MSEKPATLAGHEVSMIETLLATYYPMARGGNRIVNGAEVYLPPDLDAAQLIAKLLALKLRYDERADAKADEWRGL